MVHLAEGGDAVSGGDTHRDVHALEPVAPNGTTLSTLAVSNDEAGFADVLAWIAEHAPGPRLVGLLEHSHPYDPERHTTATAALSNS
jgi:hypothetical protein